MNETVSIGVASLLTGRSIDTLRRWDGDGKLPSIRKEKNSNRYYEIAALELAIQNESKFRAAHKWVSCSERFEPLPCYYSRDSFIFKSRHDRMGRDIIAMEQKPPHPHILVAITGEIGENSFAHNLGAWPDTPGVFFSYDFLNQEIILADRGRGILKTLQRVRPRLDNHKDALYTAFTEEISGRYPERRGRGLKYIRERVAELKLSLSFQSGDMMIEIDNNGELVFTEKPPIQGCLARISF